MPLLRLGLPEHLAIVANAAVFSDIVGPLIIEQKPIYLTAHKL